MKRSTKSIVIIRVSQLERRGQILKWKKAASTRCMKFQWFIVKTAHTSEVDLFMSYFSAYNFFFHLLGVFLFFVKCLKINKTARLNKKRREREKIFHGARFFSFTFGLSQSEMFTADASAKRAVSRSSLLFNRQFSAEFLTPPSLAERNYRFRPSLQLISPFWWLNLARFCRPLMITNSH